ncbi:class II histone deacetylase [Lichenifustis flavocetrariae]|uniref:Class II histone deacetylase n=1 Tax=Lichenifustis flavocetrariae TaxID=2949735 RepID=A0AA41YZV0_9HYPH|nr:class II histone deacetylase [Lichenifustis flavocetrariae]MCW6511616.1 class II histone deacetylase [Lichenifustis flavocetrariae]
MATGWNFHELYLWHDTGNAASIHPAGLTIEPGEHAENAATKRRFRNLLEVSGLLDQLAVLPSVPIDEGDLALFHTGDYIARIKEASAGRGGDASHLTPFGPGSYEIARLAVGGTTAVIEAVVTGRVRNGYALVRPPGHHAERERGLGFCLFGNVPIAIMKARAAHKLGRVAVVDWDVHHGNGTQQAFYEDPETLTISLHQDGLFPLESGSLAERGAGAGQGFNINLPLPAGSGVGAYEAAFERLVVPALRRFRPDLIVVCSGFDASALDPLGRMMLHSDGYRSLTRLLMEAADDLCGGRIAMSHEGGYSASYVPYCGLAVMEQLSGIRTSVVDPFLGSFSRYPGQDLQPHQDDVIRAALPMLSGL